MVSLFRHAPIDFYFKKDAENFVVEEVPMYECVGKGSWLYLTIRKKNMTTDQAQKALSEQCGCKLRDMGYAGLKDKHGMTIQRISLPVKYMDALEKFKHPNMKILKKELHNNKLKMGHLKGNRFYLKLKKVNPVNAQKITEVIEKIKTYGSPNYFGYQRFGKEGDNFEQAKKILNGELSLKPHMERLLLNAYQSKLFNDWLEERIKVSSTFTLTKKELYTLYPKEIVDFAYEQSHPFKLFEGDVIMRYHKGKPYLLDDVEKFNTREAVPSGLLAGRRVLRAEGFAGEIEEKHFEFINTDGGRRAAWIFPEFDQYRYNDKEWQYEMNFFLPSGCYATVVLDLIANRKVVF